jgi:hypothetical protein
LADIPSIESGGRRASGFAYYKIEAKNAPGWQRLFYSLKAVSTLFNSGALSKGLLAC